MATGRLLSIVAPFMCANEFTLTVTLVVFVMLTAILLFIILLLCVSKSFRAFFFRDAAKRKKAAAKKAKKAEQTQAEQTQSDTAEQAQSDKTSAQPQSDRVSPRRQSRSAKNKPTGILDAVPTVPLDFPVPDASVKPRGSRRSKNDGDVYGDLPTVALPKTAPQPTGSDGRRAYTPRTVTITRARSSADSVKAANYEKDKPQSGTRGASASPRKKN